MKKIPVFCFCLFLFSFLSPAFAQVRLPLQEGIAQYQQENYEEAIEILTKLRQREPASSQAAFFLGMAYKQVMDYPKAAANLQDAVTLKPPVRDALLELADTLNQLNKLDEAVKWLDVAEKEGFSPARTAFLRGLILSKQNKNQEAIDYFEKAKKLEPAYVQSAEFQIGISLIKDRKLDLAKARFQAVISRDPLSDLAGFARQYQSMVEERLYLERPLRLTIGVMAGYDTNLVSKPLESSVAGDITDEKGSTLSTSLRLDYVPKLEGPWLFNAQYAAASNVNSNHTHSHDSLANSFSVSPGYNFGRFSLNLTAAYTNVLLRTDPDLQPAPDSAPGYKRYLDYTSIGPTFRFLVNQNNILDLFAGYDKKNYYNQKAVSPDALRDSTGLRTYLSWIWLFRENSFLNLRYDFTDEDADGRQWTNKGNRITANVSIPVLPEETAKRVGPLTLQLTGSAFYQNYSNETDYGIVKTTRKDKVYTGSLGLAWKFWKYASFIAQYTRTQNESNVPIYEYNRDQYTAGFEFRY
ncbi:MAG: tetratricopeptide repeat protein [bacterium]